MHKRSVKPIPRRKRNALMRLLIDFAYSPAPPDQKILESSSAAFKSMLDAIGMSNHPDQVLHVLLGLHYITLEAEKNSPDSVIILTPEGKAYFERKADDFRKTIVSGVFIPILVAVITTVITVYILPTAGTQARQLFQSPGATPTAQPSVAAVLSTPIEPLESD